MSESDEPEDDADDQDVNVLAAGIVRQATRERPDRADNEEATDEA